MYTITSKQDKFKDIQRSAANLQLPTGERHIPTLHVAVLHRQIPHCARL